MEWSFFGKPKRKLAKRSYFRHERTKQQYRQIYSVTAPLSSSASALFASCQLSELLEDFSPKFIKDPKLNEAAMLNHISHKPTQEALITEHAGKSCERWTNQKSRSRGSRAFLISREDLFVWVRVATIVFDESSYFSWSEPEMSLLTSILQRQLVPSPLRRGEFQISRKFNWCIKRIFV